MSESRKQPIEWLDALAGMISPTGRDCDYLIAASTAWARSQWGKSSTSAKERAVDPAETFPDLTERLRTLTGRDETNIATCVTAESRENLLQWALILCRLHHQCEGNPEAARGNIHSGARCLAAVGSDHGQAIIGRMASGRADGRSPEWPLVPGFVHAALESLADRIDDSVAMVLISPLDFHDMLRPISPEQLVAISDACQRHRACLIIDHSLIPPHGGGHFWVHDAIASVNADGVIMSAGLVGGGTGGLLSLGESLAIQLSASTSQAFASTNRCHSAALAGATLDQWIERSWCDVELDELPTELAGRLAKRECVRDLHVTGRSIGIELDIPSAEWLKSAADCQLHATAAGDFAIAMQLPLVFSTRDVASFCDRIDRVFDQIEHAERGAEIASPVSSSQSRSSVSADSAGEDSTLENLQEENTDNSEYDVGENAHLNEDFDEDFEDDLNEDSYRDEDRHAPAMPADPENQS